MSPEKIRRVVVNVATGTHFLKGQARLETTMRELGEHHIVPWGARHPEIPSAGGWPLPKHWPSHMDKAYAFKAYPDCWVVEHDGRLVEIGHAAAQHNYNLVMVNDTNAVLEVKR